MQLSVEFWIQITVYGVSIGSFAGVVLTKLKYLDKKVERYNNLGERIVKIEQSNRYAHNRISDLVEDFKKE